MDFPILHDPGSIEMVLSTVYKTDPPKLVDRDFLTNLGFKREVDEGLLKLLTFLGLIDDHGQPSVLWEKSRDPEQAPLLLGIAVRAAYGSLFKEFPTAYKEEGLVLMDFFRSNTGASDADVAYMILTFKVLCDLAGLDDGEMVRQVLEPVIDEVEEEKPEKGKKKKKKSAETEKPVETEKPEDAQEPDSGPVIRISINIDLDDRSDPDLRDLAMKLLKRQLEL